MAHVRGVSIATQEVNTMAIPHANPGQPVSVRPFGATLAQQQTTAVFKTQRLEVMRLVLPQGKSMREHKVAGAITVHCLEGRIAFAHGTENQVLAAGELLYLDGGVEHSLTALEDASALLTIVLCP